MKTIADLCKKCQGGCCTTVFLGKYDIEKLKKAGKHFNIKKVEGGHEFVETENGKCPFLNEGIGCILSDDLKPLDCILFPLAFKMEGKNIKFFLNTKCPYFSEIPVDWINKTMKWFELHINQWSEDEIKTYIKRQEGHFKEIEHH